MDKKKTSMLAVLIVLILLILIFINYTNFEEKPKNNKEKKLNIQNMINIASDGDIIEIPSGIYYENITIDKPLNLIGKNKEETIIDGTSEDIVILIKSDNVEINNFTIRNSGGHKGNSGIKINSDNNKIKNCEIYRTKSGIYINKGKNNILSNCHLHTNGEGIYCYESLKNIIKNSQFQHNAFALNIESSEGTTVEKSYIHTNGIGIYGKKSKNTKITQSAICDNGQDGGGIWFFECEEIDIKNCNINHNSIGIRLENTDSIISDCDLHFNMYNTMRMVNVKKTTISNCNIEDSYREAIYLKESRCKLENNNIINTTLSALKIDKKSFCKAKNNFWNAVTGPSYSSFGLGEKISFKPLKTRIFPWKLKPIKNIGSNFSKKEGFEKIKIDNKRFKPIEFTEKDSDSDGAPDTWEEKYNYNPDSWDDHCNLDPDEDALNNIEECYTDRYGSNPYYKDIFIELDRFEGINKPSNEFIEKAEDIFKEQKISLHIDTGNLGGGEEIPLNSISSCVEFRDVYWDYFLHNNLDNPRKGIFHYALVSNDIDELYEGFVFVGWDQLDTTGMAIQPIYNNNKFMKKDQLIISGIIHELGHTMGLFIDDHGGIDNVESGKYKFTLQSFRYKNYKSCMNYRYVYLLLGFSDGTNGKGDFDDYNNLDWGFFKNSDFDLNEGGKRL